MRTVGLSSIVIVVALFLAFNKSSLGMALYCWSVPTTWIATRAEMHSDQGYSRGGVGWAGGGGRGRKLHEMEEERERVRQIRETKVFWKRIIKDQEKRVVKREAKRYKETEGLAREAV